MVTGRRETTGGSRRGLAGGGSLAGAGQRQGLVEADASTCHAKEGGEGRGEALGICSALCPVAVLLGFCGQFLAS